MFFCADQLPKPRVTLQQWAGEPARPSSQWPRTYEGEFTVTTSRVILGCLTAAPTDVVVDLQVTGTFGIRVHWEACERDAIEEDWLVEHWLIQGWPMRLPE
ncbi:hypothetical protein [Actinokineospora xionganensis]|uniref:Uncharacterized protein n=1 Tax=Actinokineospora xionganensis TaxID=2684470 RepID=A0ABR7LCQ7_9PSEU|nr:hypothetical protein [Actinokineospora xionganensis]MBC6450422.1 hypothetical protein [Actinokineospora xionganensis]